MIALVSAIILSFAFTFTMFRYELKRLLKFRTCKGHYLTISRKHFPIVELQNAELFVDFAYASYYPIMHPTKSSLIVYDYNLYILLAMKYGTK